MNKQIEVRLTDRPSQIYEIERPWSTNNDEFLYPLIVIFTKNKDLYGAQSSHSPRRSSSWNVQCCNKR